MRHLWLIFAVVFFALGTARLVSVRTESPSQPPVSAPFAVAQVTPIPVATVNPCDPPALGPNEWWLGCWSTTASGDWTPSPPVFYFDGGTHSFNTPEEYIEKLHEFKMRRSDPQIVDPLIERFREVVRRRHPLSVEEVQENVWTVTLPKGPFYDTGIPITSNLSLKIWGIEGFKAQVAKKSFSATENALGTAYYMQVDFDEVSTKQSVPLTTTETPAVPADFLATLKLQVDEGDWREVMSVTVETTSKVSDAERDRMRNDPTHQAVHQGIAERAERLRKKIARRQ